MSECRVGKGAFPPVRREDSLDRYFIPASDEPIPILDAIQEHIRRLMQSESDLLEEYCERSLVDPAGRGVFVERWPDGSMRVRLSDASPWATITTYHHPENHEH